MRKRIEEATLSAEEWDFRSCPIKERAACLHYEYAREYVQARPELAAKLIGKPRPSPYDNRLKFLFSDKRHPNGLPMLCRRFSLMPWLKLPAKTRTHLIAQCQRWFPFVSSSRFSSRRVASFGRAFPAAAPIIPPPVGGIFFRRSDSEFHAPNKALQRTEAGDGVSLGPSRLTSPASVAELRGVRRSSSPLCTRSARRIPLAPCQRFAFPGHRPLRSPFPAGSAHHSPGWAHACPRLADSDFAAA